MAGLPTEQIRALLRWFKDGPVGAIPIERQERSLGILQAVTWEDAGDRLVLERLSRWHESAFAWFPEPYPVTPRSARKWLTEQILTASDRILFWIKDVRGEYIGHVGLSHFEPLSGLVSISDQVCEHPSHEGLLLAATSTLSHWASEALLLRTRSPGMSAAA